MTFQLTQNAIQQIYSGSTPPQPVLQVIDIKKINSTGALRYRIIVSDGSSFQQAMLATQLNQLVQDEKLIFKSIVQLNEYICNSVHGRRIIIILQLDVLGIADNKIGAPINIDESGGAQPAPQQAAPQQAPRAAAPQQNYQRPPQQQQAPAQQQQQFAPRQQQAPQNNFRQNVAANRPPQGRDDFSQTVILPISKLNFHVNRWTIKARVTHKSDVREFNSAKIPSGKGKLISIDLLDAQGGEIRATMFGDAVDLFSPILEVGRVYYISRGIVKAAYKKSSSLKNDFELTLDRNSVVQLCEDDDNNIPSVVFAATPIGRIPDLMKDEIIDVVALVTCISELQNVNTKTGSTMKRTLTLLDQTKATIDLTLWGNHAINFDQNFTGVVGVKGAKISDFHGYTLTSLSSTQIVLNPATPEAQAISQWSQTLDDSLEVHPLSIDNYRANNEGGAGGFGAGNRPPKERKTFGQIKEEGLGRGKPAYFQVKGTVNNIKHDVGVYYNACPTCSKKVNLQNGSWVCDKCNDSFPQCNRRYLLSLQAADHSGAQWLSAFNEVGEKILNRSAAEVAQLKEDKNDPEYEAVFQDASLRSYLFTVRAKEETYQEETRVKFSIVSLDPLDYAAESKSLLSGINKLLAVA